MIEKFVKSAKEVWKELNLKKLSEYHTDPSLSHKFFPILGSKNKATYLY